MNLVVLGQGRWGAAMGKAMERNHHEVSYVHHLEDKWPQAAQALIIALPVQYLRQTLQRFDPLPVPVLSLSKGLEISTGYRVSEVVKELWPGTQVSALSGPNLAHEIDQGLPAAAVVASDNPDHSRLFQNLLHHPRLRLYRSDDLIGVEWGGALKNIYAIAGGVAIGLKLGDNAFAALMTRALAEMTRLGVKAGGKPETFSGLSGVGDLFLTASSPTSRNHRVGRLLAEGHPLEEILKDSPGVAEGIATTQAVFKDDSISITDKPVVAAVHALLFENKSPLEAVTDLMTRAATAEGG